MGILLGPVAGTTSSSSAARADEPKIPFGLGERRLGDPELVLAPSPGVLLTVGRAMGAIGRVMGPGPDMSVWTGIDGRRPCPGASMDGPGADVEASGIFGFGGPIGVGGVAEGPLLLLLPIGTPIPIGIPRLKLGSNTGLAKPRGGAIGVPGG